MSDAPGHDVIVEAIGALHSDAAQWHKAADVVTHAAKEADGLRIDPSAFSFIGPDVADVYARLQTKLATLLNSGAVNCSSVGAALDGSADTYAAEEAANVHRFRNIY